MNLGIARHFRIPWLLAVTFLVQCRPIAVGIFFLGEIFAKFGGKLEIERKRKKRGMRE